MKKIFLQLVFIFFLSFFTSCEREEFEISNESTQNHSDYQVKKISFNDVKLNKNAFKKLKESRSKVNPSLLQRGVYNEDFGVFIDTTNIVFIEKDGKHSFTFQIINEEDKSIVENLILNSKDTEGYDAFISKYLLTQEEIVKIENGESLETKVPSTVTNVNSSYSLSVSGPCVTSTFSSEFVCYPQNGGEPVYYGGNYSGGCSGTLIYETTQIISINYGCLSGGSGGSTSGGGYNPGGGSDGGGYNPGGYWTGGGSGSSGGSQTNPNNPVLTTPNINYPTVPRDFLSSLSDDQLNWWNAIENSTPRNEIITYLNNNKIEGTNLVNPEAMAFALELIDLAIQNPSIYTSERIINWFFTPNEGIDFEYDQEFWDNPDLVFPSQDLPTWDDYSNGYPTETGADNVYGSVGGQVWQTRLQYPNGTTNTCALKVSIALNNCDIIIPNIPGQTLQGDDGKFYFLNARALNSWMRLTFGTSSSTANNNINHHEYSTATSFTNDITTNPKKGIYSLIRQANLQPSGHADILYENGTCLANCNLQMPNFQRIDIWVLN